MYKFSLGKNMWGITAKKKKSCFEEGKRSGSWLKVKNLKSCDCVIYGYTQGGGARALCVYFSAVSPE